MPDSKRPKKAKNLIRLVDVTNRDGVQTSRLGLAKLQKTMLNMFLNDMGVIKASSDSP
jgi:homocitrate synthase NifV